MEHLDLSQLSHNFKEGFAKKISEKATEALNLDQPVPLLEFNRWDSECIYVDKTAYQQILPCSKRSIFKDAKNKTRRFTK